MRNVILALSRANLSDDIIETVLTEFEFWVDSKIVRSEQKMTIESIVPIQKETDGIRSEIRILAETMKHGFERIDQKLDFTRENLEGQIVSNKENAEIQMSRIERQIAYTRENLETQIKANDKQLGLVQKLLWLLLTLVLGMFAKVVHLI